MCEAEKRSDSVRWKKSESVVGKFSGKYLLCGKFPGKYFLCVCQICWSGKSLCSVRRDICQKKKMIRPQFLGNNSNTQIMHKS